MTNPPESAWNPGLEPELPVEYRELETIFRPENVTSGFDEVAELSRRTGLAPEKLVDFRPQRLALHEVIVRVTAGIFVAEGDSETDFGLAFRAITTTIMRDYVEPKMPNLVQAHAALCRQVRARVADELDRALFVAPALPVAPAGRPWHRLFRRTSRAVSPGVTETVAEKELRVITKFKDLASAATDGLDAAIYKSLHRILSALVVGSGRLGADAEFLADLVTRHVCNRYGSRVIGRLLQPWIEQAIREQGYTPVVNAEKPVLISLKGASAAGKSSLRPLLNRVIREHDLNGQHYATISPDIWRRLLLDYDSLGPARKYAGRCTGKEMLVIDSKLDRHIRDQAGASGSIPHLLVDRFRFDSFSSEKVSRILHRTYARYVDIMYMYFVVTPPEATVERGWLRGLQVGRYKAVEDFLGHSVEAYTGMSRILFKWLAYERPIFRFEILDNSVAKGTYPKLIAAGTQRAMRILDPVALIDMERYRKINIKARAPKAVYPDAAQMAVAANMDFLRQCIRRIALVEFVDPVSAETYLRVEKGRYELIDACRCRRLMRQDTQLAEALNLLAPDLVVAANLPATDSG